jgi:hypothetical protein
MGRERSIEKRSAPSQPSRLRRVIEFLHYLHEPVRECGKVPRPWVRRDALREGTTQGSKHAALSAFVRAAPRGTVVRWYDAGHALSPRAYADARAWLLRKLRT